MDVKSLAKSKRAHTQHHSKKPHHSHKLKAPTPSSSSPSSSNEASVTAKKPLGKQQLNENTKHRYSRGLPSNWDRYGEEEEEFENVGSEGLSHKISDVVLPKSKGADFRYLVAEAQSHADTSLEGIPSLDDLIPGEFNFGLSSMLAVRGEGFLSWIGDDNFMVEDKTTGYQEASFMSLNLLALAENLEKVDLSKRLFIEPDLLPAELCADHSAVDCNEEPDKPETSEDSELAKRMSEELNLDDFATDHFTLSTSPSSSHTAAFTSSEDFLVPVNYVDVEIQQVGSSGKNKAFLPRAEANSLSAEDTRWKNSAFEAAAAEEELDMLLDFPGFKSNTSFPVSLGVSSVNPQTSNKDSVPSKTTTSLDDALDDLLEETSALMNPNVLLLPQEGNHVQPSQSGSKTQVSDDFDSWFDTL
ncbi:hypothetical protein RIF29_31360 [Crotalaria pallida]|uniref:Uncharacterized protein n=1 Tax=Crotalaria pallida TaxID=3830 RepID=A0AAN9EHX9_CROPI